MTDYYSPNMLETIKEWGTLVTEGRNRGMVAVTKGGKAVLDGKTIYWIKGDVVDPFLLLIAKEMDDNAPA